MKLSLRERELKLRQTLRSRSKATWGKLICCGAVSFLFAQGSALGGIAPFASAFTASVPFDDCAAAFFGGSLGAFLSMPWPLALKHAGSLALICAFRRLIAARFSDCRRLLTFPLVAAACVLSANLVFFAVTEFSWPSLLPAACETGAALVACYFFLRAMKTPVLSVGLSNLGAQDAAVLCVSLGSLLCCAAGLTIAGVSPARMLACFLVLFFADFKGAKGGCLVGVCVGAALSVDPAYRFLFPAYAVSGLICGVFSSFGSFAVSFFFALTAAAALFVNGMNAAAWSCLLEILIGAFLFFITPAKWLDALREYLRQSGIAPDDSLNRFVSARLRHAARNVANAASVMTDVSAKLDDVMTPEVNVIFSKLQQNICLGCGFKGECWNQLYAETARDILTISGLPARRKEPTPLEKRCPRATALVTQIRQSYTDFVGSLAAKEKMRELRGIVSDQFSGIGDFLEELAQQMMNSRIVDSVRSRTLNTALRDGGIFVDSLHYFTNPNGRVSIEITMLEDAFSLDQKRLRRLFEHVTGRKFELPEIALMELRTTLTFEERAMLRVTFGKSQIPCRENGVCGDCTRALTDPCGNRIALISDGMGTGSRAAVDSLLTCALMEELLSGGFSFPVAIKMVNCALVVKSADESMATVDGVSINVYTGEAEFFKAGAAVSFFRRGNTVTVIEAPSLPVGILREVDVARRTLRLEPGDLLLLVSDGVTFGDCGWISDELLAWSTNNMDDLAAHIASLARLRSDDNTRDDVTAVAAKILANH